MSKFLLSPITRLARQSRFASLLTVLCLGVTMPLTGAKAQRTPAPSLPSTAAAPANPTPGIPLPAGITFVQTIEGVHEYRLANGLQVLLLPDASQPRITVNIVYRVGSRHESYGETGMAHLLEHLLFKGTPRHPEIDKEIKLHGASANGTTSRDRTNYYESFLATEENLAWAIDLEADRMINSFVARKDLDSEMTVVRNEFEIGRSRPGSLLSEAVDAAIFRWHSYGKPTIGNRSDIENVSIERLQAFYRRHYRPDNATLVISGKISQPTTLALIAKHFGPIANPKQPIDPEYTVEPEQDGERSVLVRRVGETQLLAVAYRTMSAQHQDLAALYVLNHLLSTTPNGRLHKGLVETGKATSIGMSVFAGYHPGRIIAFAELRKQDAIEPVRDDLIKIIEGIASAPITEAEVARAKASFAAGYEARRANTQGLASSLTESIASGDWRLFFWQRDELAKVTVADVQRVALHYMKRDNRTVGSFIPTDKPERAEIPPRRDPTALLKDYRGGAALAQGEDFDPSQASIDKRTIVATLPGGLKLALLPKQTQGDRVRGQLTLRFGDDRSLTGTGAAPSVLGALLTKGTRRLLRGAFSDELVRLKAELSISASANTVTANFSTTRENLDALIRLMVECLREPALLPEEFDQIVRSRQQGIASALKNPQSLAGNRLRELFNAYAKEHPFYSGTLAEQRDEITNVTLDAVKRFHAEHYGAGHGTLSVVGSFEAEPIRRLAAELLDGWKSGKPYQRIARIEAQTKPLSEVVEVPDQANAVIVARHGIRMRDDNPEYPALLIANHILGGSNLSSRLGHRLRQTDGLSYGAGSGLGVGSLDDIGSFSIQASFAPGVAPRLETGICEELDRALKDGFTPEEVTTARNDLLAGRRLARGNDPSLVAALNGNLFLGRTMQWSAEFEGRLRAVTPEQVNAAFRRHIDPRRLVVIKSGSFAALPPSPAAPGEQRLPACTK